MKILLLGANGQVGWELQRSLAPLGDVVALDFDTPGALRDLPGESERWNGPVSTAPGRHSRALL